MIIHKPRTLLWQLGLALMTVQAAAVVLLGWYAYARFEQFTRDQTLDQLRRITPLLAEEFADRLGHASAETDYAALDAMAKDEGRRAGVRITVILLDGKVIADSDAAPAEMENHRQRPEIDAAINHREGSAMRHSATLGKDLMYCAQLLTIGGQPKAVIRTAMPIAAVDAQSARLVRVVGIAGAVTLMLTFALILLVSRQLSVTVSGLAQGAARFAAGDLHHRIERPPSNELAALADALNHMAEQLSEQIDMLRAQRNEQQAIHQSMSSGMIALDLNQRVLSVNRAAERLLGVNGAVARGRLLQELVREPELNRFVSSAMDGKPGMIHEFRLKAGSGATVQAVSQPLRNARDKAVGVLVLINDLTQIRRLESIRSDFAANVSHELRTPITNIKGYVETMLDVGVQNQQQAGQFLAVIKRNTDRLSLIVEDLLALARLEQPGTKASLERQPIRAARLIDSVAAQFEQAAREKRISIKIDVPAELTIHVNAQLVEQAVGNLLSNAIKYSPPETNVWISAGPSNESQAEIVVADEGPGVAPEHLPRLFERFYRVDRARSREMGGTGLGLAIVKHIALVHGGRVEVESEVGRGSKFRLILPST